MLKSRLIFFGGLLLLAVVGGAFAFSHAEGVGLFDSFYFAIITISTVGYGDIHPWTTAGKIIAICLVFAGVGSFVGVAETIAETVFAVKEEKTKREKRNMIRGLFFSDIGLELLGRMVPADLNPDELRGRLDVDASWDQNRFKLAAKLLDDHPFALNPDLLDLATIRALLRAKSDLLLRLLENPSIGEHEVFSDTLRAIYHLRDEILCRPEDLASLPGSDVRHLAGDVSRVYGLIGRQWLAYVRYLKESYPYLFHLAVRTNPFNGSACVIVK